MKCQECGIRPATVHITKIVNNNKEQINLCEQCAQEYQQHWGWGLGFQPDFSINQFLANMLQSEPERDQRSNIQTEYQCPGCGLTFREFRETGRLGCDKCYQTFNKSLQPLLRSVHGNVQHGGKIPERIGGSLKIRQQIASLKDRLQKAVELEEFEEAAKLRDQIRNLEKEEK